MLEETLTPRAFGSGIAGRYVVEALLGRGGMGAVFRVLDRVLREPVALKLYGGGGRDATEVERFQREVRLARRITHKNVARTFDIGEHAGVPFLTIELVRGESLSARMKRQGRLETPEAAAIAREISGWPRRGPRRRHHPPGSETAERDGGRDRAEW